MTYEQFYQTYHKQFDKLVNHASRLCQRHQFQEIGSELVVDTYTRLTSKGSYRKLNHKANIYPWLKKCVHNTFRDSFKYELTGKFQPFIEKPTDDPAILLEMRDQLEKVSKGLTEQEKRILYDRFVNEATYREIIEDYNLNITPQRLSQIISSWLGRIRKQYNRSLLFQ